MHIDNWMQPVDADPRTCGCGALQDCGRWTAHTLRNLGRLAGNAFFPGDLVLDRQPLLVVRVR